MKKIITVLLIAVLAFSMAACGGGNQNGEGSEGGGSNISEPGINSGNLEEADALTVLENVWAEYSEDQLFSALGGDTSEENMTMDGPGRFSLNDGTAVDNTLGFPVTSIDKIDDAASLMHMMNANTFTGAVYHVIDAGNVDALAEEIVNNLSGRQWICGIPEKLVVAKVDGYLVSCFGAVDLVDTFITNFKAVYDTTTVLNEINF